MRQREVTFKIGNFLESVSDSEQVLDAVLLDEGRDLGGPRLPLDRAVKVLEGQPSSSAARAGASSALRAACGVCGSSWCAAEDDDDLLRHLHTCA